MKLLGLDNGYNFTKTSAGVKICSTIKEGKDDLNSVTQTTLGNKTYIVGEPNGKYIASADKLKTESNIEVLKVTSLTAIGLSFPTDKFIEVNLVVGVPVGYYSNQKEEFKQMMEQLNERIYINEVGIEQHIKIKEVIVYPQSAGVVFKHSKRVKQESSLVIDIGGGTWDISQFAGLKLTKKATYQEGMLVLYEKIAQYINTTHYTSYEPSEIFDIMQRGYFTVEGTKRSMSEVDQLVEDHVAEIITKITRAFDISNVDNKFLIGGGAEELAESIIKALPGARLEENAQFTNAECFEIMGKLRFRK